MESGGYITHISTICLKCVTVGRIMQGRVQSEVQTDGAGVFIGKKKRKEKKRKSEALRVREDARPGCD